MSISASCSPSLGQSPASSSPSASTSTVAQAKKLDLGKIEVDSATVTVEKAARKSKKRCSAINQQDIDDYDLVDKSIAVPQSDDSKSTGQTVKHAVKKQKVSAAGTAEVQCFMHLRWGVVVCVSLLIAFCVAPVLFVMHSFPSL